MPAVSRSNSSLRVPSSRSRWRARSSRARLRSSATSASARASGEAASDGAAPVNAGSYRLTVSVPESDETYTGSVSIDFTIAKAPVSFTVSGSTYGYDAAAHTASAAPIAW